MLRPLAFGFYIILSGCFLSFFNLGAWGALYAISPEVFPTRLRGTGTGTAAGLGRIASILAPLIVPPLISSAAPEYCSLFSLRRSFCGGYYLRTARKARESL